MFSDSIRFKKLDRSSYSSINAGDVLSRDARNVFSFAGKSKVSGEEAGEAEVAACRKFLDTQAYAIYAFVEQWFGAVWLCRSGSPMGMRKPSWK